MGPGPHSAFALLDTSAVSTKVEIFPGVKPYFFLPLFSWALLQSCRKGGASCSSRTFCKDVRYF